MNAEVRQIEVEGVVGGFGLGIRNERGAHLIKFCDDEHFLQIGSQNIIHLEISSR